MLLSVRFHLENVLPMPSLRHASAGTSNARLKVGCAQSSSSRGRVVTLHPGRQSVPVPGAWTLTQRMLLGCSFQT